MALSRNLKMLLGVHDLSAGNFAGMAGMSSTTVSYWLNGHREPSAENLIALAEFFHVDPVALLREEEREFIVRVGDRERFAAVEDYVFDLYQQAGLLHEQPKPIPLRKRR